MKACLAAGDVDGALSCYSSDTRDDYQAIFTALGDQLPQVAREMQAIELISIEDGLAKYPGAMRSTRDSSTASRITSILTAARKGFGKYTGIRRAAIDRIAGCCRQIPRAKMHGRENAD